MVPVVQEKQVKKHTKGQKRISLEHCTYIIKSSYSTVQLQSVFMQTEECCILSICHVFKCKIVQTYLTVTFFGIRAIATTHWVMQKCLQHAFSLCLKHKLTVETQESCVLTVGLCLRHRLHACTNIFACTNRLGVSLQSLWYQKCIRQLHLRSTILHSEQDILWTLALAAPQICIFGALISLSMQTDNWHCS